jgi:Flp pilus assembly protein TadD
MVNLAIHLINAVLVYLLVLFTFRTPYFSNQLSAKSEKSIVSSKKDEMEHYRPGTDSPSLLTTNYSLLTTDYSRFFAFAVALLFVSHPVQTEAVTYVFQRFASLVSMFYLLSLVLYIKARLKSHSAESMAQGVIDNPKGAVALSPLKGPLPYALCSLLCAVLAMKTKENAFTLPLVITLYEFLFFTGPLKSRILRLIPFLLTMLIIPVTLAGLSNTAAEIISQIENPLAVGYEQLSRTGYLFTQFRVVVTYIRLLFLPLNQNIDYAYPLSDSFFELPVLISFLFLTCLFGTAVYLIYKTQSAKSREQSVDDSVPYALGAMRLAAFGILWFFITLSLESGVIPLAMIINEYRVYLPSVGFFLALVAGAALLINRIAIAMRYALCAMLILVLALASATYARNALWKDKISLWEDVVSKNPNSPKVYNNLGIAYYEKGLYDKAIEVYRRSISLSPDNFFAYSNLGVAYAVIGRIDLAIENLTRAISLEPQNGVAHANLARAHRRLGQYEKAVENYRQAVALAPYNEMAFYGLGSTYMILGEFDNALAAFTRFVELSPQNAEAYRSRGMAYLKKGDMGKAAEDFSRACSLGSREACVHMKMIR